MFQGKRLADLILRDVGEKIRQENAATKPKLAAILIGSNPASKVYLMHKEKACSQVGIESEIIHMPERTTNRTAESVMQQFATRDDVHGILLQLPLPQHLDERFLSILFHLTKTWMD